MEARFDPHNSNPKRHQKQAAIILRGVNHRDNAANNANVDASDEATKAMRNGIALREYYNSVTGVNEYLTLK
jgi:hypothetical protein